MHPILIALEGIDGAGTTTQLPRLAAHLARRGHRVLTTCEPSRGPIGTMVRACLRHELALPDAALALLFAADRLAHLADEVVPFAAGAGAPPPVAICDRYVMSSLAYQGSRLPLEWVRTLNRLAPPADLTVFFRVSQATGQARRAARGGPPERFDAAAEQATVAAAYERLVAEDPAAVWVLDAEPDVDTVERALCDAVDQALAKMTAAGPSAGPAVARAREHSF